MGDPDKLLGDAPNRSYTEKLERFTRFATPELRKIFSELELPSTGAALDLGCGTGIATRLLSEAMGSTVYLVGLDLSLFHLKAARREHQLPLVQADLEQLCFTDRTFEFIWCCNTINHLADSVKVLRAVRRLLKPDGRLVLAQSMLLQEMYFAWDSHLDDAVRIASHKYYRERYGLGPSDTAAVRRLVGIMRAAGFKDAAPRTYVIERVQPLSFTDREYFENVVFAGLWSDKIRPYLDSDNLAKLDQYCDPGSPGYWLDRDDFHHIQTITICQGRMIT